MRIGRMPSGVKHGIGDGSAKANVTAVALRHGFSHLGQFSAQYRVLVKIQAPPSARRGQHWCGDEDTGQ